MNGKILSLSFPIMTAISLGLATNFTATADAAEKADPGLNSPAVAFFEKKIRPILAQHCYTCHAADTKPSGNLRVDDRNGLLTGGNAGPAVVPGNPEKSLLLRRVSQTAEKGRMPREGQALTEEQIADLTKWIADGAAWPAIKAPEFIGKPNPDYEKPEKNIGPGNL